MKLSRVEFAHRIFGTRLSRLQAGHALPAMIRDMVELRRAMEASGYVPNKKDYSPRQLRIISEYIQHHPCVVNEYVMKFQNFSIKNRKDL